MSAETAVMEMLLCLDVCVCVCVYMYVYIYIYIYIYTHTHINGICTNTNCGALNMLVIASWPAQVQPLSPVTQRRTIKTLYIICTVHKVHYIAVQYEPTGCTIYFQFISIIDLYMLRASLLLIIRIPVNSQSTYTHDIYQLLYIQSSTS
jgi:hypothetical protein